MSTATATMTEPVASQELKVEQIYTYPIKSIRGISLPTLPATPMGFPLDRRYMLVTTEIDPKTNHLTNMHISGFTEMCLFSTHLPSSHPDPSDISNLSHIEVRYALPHSFKDNSMSVASEPLSLPLAPEVSSLSTVAIRMHHSPTTAHDMGPEYNDWFSLRFGYPVKLLYLGANRRKVLGNVAPAISAAQARGDLAEYAGLKNAAEGEGSSTTAGAGAGSSWLGNLTSAITNTVANVTGSLVSNANTNETSTTGIDQGITFADVAPFLIVSRTSYANAAARLSSSSSATSTEELDITKFRPNIVISGASEAFDEDYWGELSFSSSSSSPSSTTKLTLTANCARCNSLNVDYQTGKVAEGQSGKVLALLSRDRRIDPGSKWSPVFGRYAFLGGDSKGEGENDRASAGHAAAAAAAAAAAVITVGDTVRVSKRNQERTRWEWPGLGTYPKDVVASMS